MSWFRRRNHSDPYWRYAPNVSYLAPSPGVSVVVSIKRGHAWEPPVSVRLTNDGPGRMANVEPVSFGPFTDTERPQHISELRANLSGGEVMCGVLFYGSGNTVPSGGSIQFSSGSLVITLT